MSNPFTCDYRKELYLAEKRSFAVTRMSFSTICLIILLLQSVIIYASFNVVPDTIGLIFNTIGSFGWLFILYISYVDYTKYNKKYVAAKLDYRLAKLDNV